MKTTINNNIHFEDGLETRFLSELKHIFPNFDLEIWAWHFNVKKLGKGQYEITVEFHIIYQGVKKELVYVKHTTDSRLVDDLKDNRGPLIRKTIINIISNDTFLEEMCDVLESLNYEY